MHGKKCEDGDNSENKAGLLKELSILIAWSLEASIESADSMAARGYGLSGRSSFHLFKITVQDVILLIGIGVCGGVTVAGCFFGRTTIQYYPKLLVPNVREWQDMLHRFFWYINVYASGN